MRAFDRFGRFLFSRLPHYDPRLYRFCQRYVDRYNGENNSDIRTNGELQFMSETLVNCQTVFDVGANRGDWTALALEINPSLTVHCFEPSQATYEQLLAQGFPASVICNDFGLSSTPGERRLYVFEEGAGINSLYHREGLEDSHGLAPPVRSEIVSLKTLDHYCQEHGIQTVDYLKVDVEGHELEVFRGASRMLEAGSIRIAQFEYGGCNIDARVLLKDFFAFFEAFGYSLYKLYPERLRRIARYDQCLEGFQYQNWVAMKGKAAALGTRLQGQLKTASQGELLAQDASKGQQER